MPSHVYTIGEFITEISALGTADTYPYASLSGVSTNSCRLVSIDGNTGAIEFVRRGATQVGKISQAAVAKLVSALATGKAIEINALYGGSGNFRSALEALVVRTPHVFLCKIDGKKHFYRDISREHPIGTIEITENPTVEIFAGTITQENRSEDELNLIVGMRSPESPYGVVTILDDDDYSYQVLCVNESKHSTGIRTISKPLLKEWIEAVKIAPDKGAESIRDDLTGKSEIDKFEYGNAGVLIKLAKMAVGQLAHTVVDVSSYWHRRMGRSEKADMPKTDRLALALKLFAEKRYEEEWQSKTNTEEHQSIYSMSDLTPEQLAAGSLDDFYNNFLLKVWVFKNGGSRKYGQLDNAEKTAYRQFVVDLKTQLKGFDTYFPPSTKCPAGMGVGMLTEIMMRFWPKSCCSYNANLIHEALVTLGLAEGDFVWPKTPSIYQDFMGKCATILCKMEQMKLPRRPNPNNDEPPDYITVNEFLWFVHDYKDLIKEEIMSKAMKPADYSKSGNQPKAKKPQVNLSNAEDVVLLRLAAALRAKPFAILAGHSGTGKSRMVRQLAYMTAAAGNHKVLFEDADGKPLKSPGNFCMVQVKPNWHDSTDLLGYYSELKDGFKGADFVKFICKAYAYPDVPFFVCLDEMNLAPVEQYFAEYLSAIESRKIDDVVILAEDATEKTIKSVITDRLLADEVWRTKAGAQDFTGLGCEFTQSEHWLKKYGLTIPRNLFVVGTVNMDESTNQFSRKVLDRAFTLEMTDADFEHFGDKNPEPTFADFAGDEFAKALLDGEVVAKKPEAGAPQPEKDAFANQVKNLTSLQPVLDGTSFVVAYRFANEYMLYANALGKMCDVMDVSGDAAATSGEAKPVEAAAKRPDAFDDMILMKVLPRITGDAEMVMRIFAGDPGRDNEPRALDDADVGGLAKLLGKESASFGKMKEIVKRGESSGSGTLTFWP